MFDLPWHLFASLSSVSLFTRLHPRDTMYLGTTTIRSPAIITKLHAHICGTLKRCRNEVPGYQTRILSEIILNLTIRPAGIVLGIIRVQGASRYSGLC